jgi:transposase
MNATTIGLDIAKNSFHVHGVNAHGKKVVSKSLTRKQVLPYFANLPPCLVGIEACGGAHYWGREIGKLGHTVRLMAPQFVKPYVKSNKNDAADAEAICEAVTRPNMRFVPVKTVDQQSTLSLHRVRQSAVEARTEQANMIRGLLMEYGIVIPQGIRAVPANLPDILEDADNGIDGKMRELLRLMSDHLKSLDERVDILEARIAEASRQDSRVARLMAVPGIGLLTASALVATLGSMENFDGGREVSAWLGVVPRQHSTGGKTTLLGIGRRGDSYLRTLLIHGARAVIQYAEKRQDGLGAWIRKLLSRRNKNVVAVALANKNARIVWALLKHGRDFKIDYHAAATA